MPVYCGNLTSHNVRASSGKRGSRKAHSRSTCRRVSGKAQADGRCARSGKRCVVRASAARRFNPFKYVAPVRRPSSRRRSRTTQKAAPAQSSANLMDCLYLGEDECNSPCVFENGSCGLPSSSRIEPIYGEEPLVRLESKKSSRKKKRSTEYNNRKKQNLRANQRARKQLAEALAA